MRILLAALLAGSAVPAAAQHAAHAAPAAPTAPSCTPEHAAMGHCTLAEEPAPAARPADPHAGHAKPDKPAAPAAANDPHAAHGTTAPAPAPQPDPHAGHDTGQQSPSDSHAGHSMGIAAPPPGASQQPPPAAARSGPENAADLIFGQLAMAKARGDLNREHGGLRASRVLFDRLEVGFANGHRTYSWDDAQFWSGGDINKLWIKSQGEGQSGGELETAEVQALYSRAIDPWFDVQAGLRYDFRPDPRRAYLVLGVQGLAPYWFEVEGQAFVSNKGEVSARFEAEYDQKITQSLVLQPAIELDFALQDVAELGIGSGLSTGELGLRLRYDFYPASGPAVIAPYLGIVYERAFGDTARFARQREEDVGGWRFILGLRTWF